MLYGCLWYDKSNYIGFKLDHRDDVFVFVDEDEDEEAQDGQDQEDAEGVDGLDVVGVNDMVRFHYSTQTNHFCDYSV